MAGIITAEIFINIEIILIPDLEATEVEEVIPEQLLEEFMPELQEDQAPVLQQEILQV